MRRQRGHRRFEDLESFVEQFTENLQAEARRESRQGRGSSIAKLYWANKAGAYKEILHPSPPCPIPLEDLRRHFWGVFARHDARGGAPRPPNLRLPRLASPGVLCKEFTAEEIKEKLRRAKNSSPGLDEIRFDLLKNRDPEAQTLEVIFEDCRRFRRTPAQWKEVRTSLKFKGGDPNDPSNWRPIVLCNTMYKLYAQCLAARVNLWAASGQAISPQQKAFRGQEGCAEHRFLLQTVLDVTHRSKDECAVAWLDLADAFLSIPRCHVFQMLAEFGMPRDFVALLQELCDGCATTLKVGREETKDWIPLRTGLKEGCPLSPILFQLAIEPLLRFVDRRARGFNLYGTRVAVLAYADDLVLVAESAMELQGMLDDATAVVDWIGLRFKARKCRALHYLDGNCRATVFRVQGKAITSLKDGETVQYLGMPIGPRKQPETLAGDFADKADTIEASQLKPWQKVNMVKTNLLRETLSVVRDRAVPKRELHKIEVRFKEVLSQWGRPDQMEARDLTVQELCDVEVVAHAFLLLSSHDEVVGTVARGALFDIVDESFIQYPNQQVVASYLNGDHEDLVRHRNTRSTSLWARARYATRRLNKLIHCRWVSKGGELCLGVSGGVIFPENRKTVAPSLKRALSDC